jgi:hypothetical protein
MTAVIRMPRLCRGLAPVPDGDALLVDSSLAAEGEGRG